MPMESPPDLQGQLFSRPTTNYTHSPCTLTSIMLKRSKPSKPPISKKRDMKACGWISIVIVLANLAFAGCAKKSSSVDTAPLQNSFKSAEPATQTSVDKVVAAVKSEDYRGALAELKTLASQAKLTPEQTQAIKDVMAQAQKALTDMASKAAEGAGKALDDVKKNLSK
jgi:hypothetical protein